MCFVDLVSQALGFLIRFYAAELRNILNLQIKHNKAMEYFLNSGQSISLGKKIASGGEGTVYEIDGSKVAKIYFEPQGRLPQNECVCE